MELDEFRKMGKAELFEYVTGECIKQGIDFDKTQDIQYCKQYCGLVDTPKTADGCDKFADLEKDYCFKEEAIQEKNGRICDKIADDGIKKSCFNRITEDILDAPRTIE